MPQAVRDDKIGPTPETVAKLRPDPFLRMKMRNQLASGNSVMNWKMYDAGVDIERAFRLITSPVAVRCSNYERSLGVGSAEDWTVKQIELIRRYDAWAALMKVRRVPLGPVFDVVVDGLSCSEVDAKWRCYEGWAIDVLRKALRLYVQKLDAGGDNW